MNSLGGAFLSSNLPILLGGLILILLLKVNPLSTRYVLVHDQIKGITDAGKELHENKLSDLLLIHGVNANNFSESDFVYLDNAWPKRRSPNKLVLLSCGNFHESTMRLAYANSSFFGAIIPYMLDSSLSAVEN